LEPAVDLRPGSHFDRYVIESLLGQGGMGRVYRARDPKLQRAVALKVLHVDRRPMHDGGAERLLEEARAAARFEHANTIAVYDVGEFEGTPFIAMELVVGRSLRSMVGDASVPLDARVGYVTDVARALAAAHEHGIVHRDIKPENVMVRRDGVVKVLDFGIARPLHAPLELGPQSVRYDDDAYEAWARDSGLLGTPRYMAPEQLRGEPVDARADQFAWGVTAYELLTGKSPWPDTAEMSFSLVLSIVNDSPVDDAPLLRSCPASVAAVVKRALSKSPAARFPSMADVVEALSGPARALAPAVESAQPAPTASTTMRRRSPAWIALLAVVAGLGLVGAVARARWQPAPVPSAAPVPASTQSAAPTFLALRPHDPRRLTADERCEEFPAFTPDGSSVIYAAETGDNENIVVQSLADGSTRTLTHPKGWDQAPAVSPDGRWVAFLRGDDKELGTYVVDFDGRTEPRPIASGSTHPAFSPDGTALWAGKRKQPTRYAFPSGEPQRTLESPPNSGAPLLAELRDGRVVAAYPAAEAGAPSGIALFSPAGAMSWLVQNDAEEDLTLTPDGRHVLGVQTTDGHNLELFSVPLAGGEATPVVSSDLRPAKGIAFSPDGSRLVWSTCRGTWNVGSFDPKGTFVPETSSSWTESAAAGIPGTRSIAVVSEAVGVASLWVRDRSGHEQPRKVSPAGMRGLRDNLDVAPDGRTAVVEVAGSGLALVRLDDATARQLTTDPSDTRPMFLRDGRIVFTRRSSEGSRVFVVDPGGGAPVAWLDPATLEAAPCPVDDRVAFLEGAKSATLPVMLDRATGKKRRLSPKLDAGRYMSVAFSGDCKRVAVVAGESRMVEVDAETGAVLRQGDAGSMLQALRYIGDELWAARAGYRGNVWIADLDVVDAASGH
jgi:Tol biopolymer transport system component